MVNIRNKLSIKPPILQSAIAGVADKSFCQKLLNLGIGMVTLGGFPADLVNYEASKKLVSRGRVEFLPPINEKDFSEWARNTMALDKVREDQIVAVNLRITRIDELSKMWLRNLETKVDVMELNLHCRQKEVTSIGGGENLLQNMDTLNKLLCEVSKITNKIKIGVKIRGSSIWEIQPLIDTLERNSIDYIHIDLMIEGENRADLNLLSSVCDTTNLPVIGNNSIREIEDIKKMLEKGACAVSLARPLIDKPELVSALIKKLDGIQ